MLETPYFVPEAPTRQDSDLALPRVRTNAGKRRLLYSTVQRYNQLPLNMRESSVSTFKRTLRDVLLDV